MEQAGIPSVSMMYADQVNFHKNVALNTGTPAVRYVTVPRIGVAEELVATYYDNIIAALTDPLTAKEQEEGLYSPPAPPRILFEGTYDESQDFLQQTVLVENCRNCPIAKYTDGLPVIIPTEEKVAEMLTGTSHDPTEVIATQLAGQGWGGITPAGRQISYAQKFTATVEKAAICAVMAGCKPEYMPVVLAIAQSGGGTTSCPGTSSMFTTIFCVSGPIAKELGMNPGQNAMDVGNPANVTLGRVGSLMSINFGGCITGLVRTDTGNMEHNVCFPEDLEGLPPGWETFAEECSYYDEESETTKNFTREDSVVGKAAGWSMVTGLFSFPGYYRSLNSGTMGIARYLGVEGIPGKYNWMEAILPLFVKMMPSPGGTLFIMHMNLAELLYEYGFKSKAEVYQWMYDTYYITVHDYHYSGLFDHATDGGNRVERTSGKTWLELIETNPDYKLHRFGGSSPSSNCILVSDSFADEHWYGGIFIGRPSATPIDPWR